MKTVTFEELDCSKVSIKNLILTHTPTDKNIIHVCLCSNFLRQALNATSQNSKLDELQADGWIYDTMSTKLSSNFYIMSPNDLAIAIFYQQDDFPNLVLYNYFYLQLQKIYPELQLTNGSNDLIYQNHKVSGMNTYGLMHNWLVTTLPLTFDDPVLWIKRYSLKPAKFMPGTLPNRDQCYQYLKDIYSPENIQYLYQLTNQQGILNNEIN